MEKEALIGSKILVNGGKRLDGKPRLVIYIPENIRQRLELIAGDEVEIGNIRKTGRNLLNKNKFKKKNDIQNESKSPNSETERTDENRDEVRVTEQSEQLP